MNFKPTRWKVVVSLLVFSITDLVHWYYQAYDSNLLIHSAPSIVVYGLWSFFQKR